jgi:hypothetical protein
VFGLGKRDQVGVTTTTPPGKGVGTVSAGEVDRGSSGAGATSTGKGRPTPSRREAEQRNRRSIVSTPVLKPNATKAEKKAAKAAERERWNAERTQQRAAMLSGDESHLPARDKGPHRRWARDFVDARHNLSEYFLPVSFAVMLVTLVPVSYVRNWSAVVLYAFIVVALIDTALMTRKLVRGVEARYPGTGRSLRYYAVMRALQMRRLRLPRAQVARGAYPK